MAAVLSQHRDLGTLLLGLRSNSLALGSSQCEEFLGLMTSRNMQVRGPNSARLAGQPCSSCLGGQDFVAGVSNIRCSMDDFSSLSEDGPKEPTLPKFNRLPYSSTAIAKAMEPTDVAVDANLRTATGKRRRGRQYKKATPAQTIAGSVIGAACALGVFNVTMEAYNYLLTNPPAHDLPMGITGEVNQLLLTVLTGFGGLAVGMFAVSSFGLLLLSIKLLEAPPPPPKP